MVSLGAYVKCNVSYISSIKHVISRVLSLYDELRL